MTVLLGSVRDFASLRIVLTDSRAHSYSYPMGTEGEKQSSCQTDNSPSSSAEVKKGHSYISPLLHSFGSCRKTSLFTLSVVIFDVIPSCFWPSCSASFFHGKSPIPVSDLFPSFVRSTHAPSSRWTVTPDDKFVYIYIYIYVYLYITIQYL